MFWVNSHVRSSYIWCEKKYFLLFRLRFGSSSLKTEINSLHFSSFFFKPQKWPNEWQKIIFNIVESPISLEWLFLSSLKRSIKYLRGSWVLYEICEYFFSYCMTEKKTRTNFVKNGEARKEVEIAEWREKRIWLLSILIHFGQFHIGKTVFKFLMYSVKIPH